MTTKLQQLFPIIQSRGEVLQKIFASDRLKYIYDSWQIEQQEKFMNFCTGVCGVKMLYDGFFKEIMNPEYVPERLNSLLSLLIGKKVHIVKVLPNDSTRIAEESSLLITDIVVELEDGSIANVEIQKIGYMFPGQRSACYAADLLLRQYKRLRSKTNKDFSYKNIKTVYTIVFFDKSPMEFQNFPETYIHKFEQMSDTGIHLELLQKYIFVPLDIFRKKQHNKDIETELDAWLIFLCMDEPEMIERLISAYPQFRDMYEEIYRLCQNVEKVMEMFSEELRELDRNTVQYMIDFMQERINELQEEIIQAEEKKQQIEEEKRKAEEEKRKAEEKNQMLLREKELEIQRLKKLLHEKTLN